MSKPVYGKNAVQLKHNERSTGGGWLLAAAFILFLGWAPFQRGLFNSQQLIFEKPLFVSALLCCLMLFGWVGLNYKKFKLQEQSDLLVPAAFMLPIIYALTLFVAVSHFSAMNMLFIQTMYAAVFIISFYLLKQKQVNFAVQQAILSIAYIIVWFGLLNWLGSGKLAGSLVGWFTNEVVNGTYNGALITDSNGLRLTSIFQYANTYAAFLMAFLFVALFALVRSKKGYGWLIHGFMLVPIIVSMLLTLSRGGLVMMPVVFILLLLFLKSVQQILWIIHLGISGVAALIIASPVTNLGISLNTDFTSSSALKGWSYLLGASLLTAGLSWAVQRYLAPWLRGKLDGENSRKLNGMWIPLGSVALVGIIAFLLIGTGVRSILPDHIEVRLENINFKQHSVLERITFYKDAVKVIKDNPVLGIGGDGWQAVFGQYQNNPYVSHQVHNFFLQYLIEVGIVGFVVFMSFILYIFYKYIRGYTARKQDEFSNGFFYLIIALSILVHSLLDFNMSYAFMGILVFLGMAGMAVVMDSKPLRRNWNKAGVRYGYLAILTGGAVFMLVLSINYISSNNAGNKARQLFSVSQSYDELKAPLVKALKIRPGHPESTIYLSSLDQQVYSQTQNDQFLEESHTLLTTALKREPYDKELLKQLVSYYDLKNQSDLALKVYHDNANKYNWDIDWYSTLISRSLMQGEQALNLKDDAAKQKYFTIGLQAYDHVTAGVEHLKTLPPEQLQGNPFSVTPLIALNAGKIKFMMGEVQEASDILKQALSADYADVTNREIARWYLAALKKNGGQDQAVHDLLIAADAQEAARIDEILAKQY